MTDKVLVTGAEGFIGSHLVEHLIRKGYNVKALVLYNSFNSWGWLDSLSKEILSSIEIYLGDIRDPNSIKLAMKECSQVYHLAALIGIPYSYAAPDSYVDTNIKGTLNVLQAARDLETKRVIITSTSEVYGTAIQVPIDERHPRQPQSPYSATKIAADALAESFYRSFKTPVTIVRPFNTYGPRQSARAVIPSIISQILSKRDTISLGAITPTRDLVYVKDTVTGFEKIANSKKTIGEDVNIATQTEISVENIAKMIIAKMNPNVTIITDVNRLRPKDSEVERLFGSNEKLFNLTNWKPEYTFEKGIEETINWFSIPQNLVQYKSDMYNI